MITFETLNNISIDDILDVFNLSFSDYVVPLRLTKEQLEIKLKGDGIRLDLSVGAFEHKQLIAFMLHGYTISGNIKTAYNAGTGVIPAKRGNNLTLKMHEHILPVLQKNGIEKIKLEVIISNDVALKIYKQIGFKITRQLSCFKGKLITTPNPMRFEIRELGVYNWPIIESFWDIQPSWQNSISAMEQLNLSNTSVGIYENEALLGYLIYNPKLKRIHQLAVAKNYRRSGLAMQLLEYISSNYTNEVSIINIDNQSTATIKLMKDVGLTNFIEQYEMELML